MHTSLGPVRALLLSAAAAAVALAVLPEVGQCAVVPATVVAPPEPRGDGDQWTTIFFDSFDAPEVNTTLWNVANNRTHGDQEWQLYMADDVYVEASSLVLRTQVRDVPYGPDRVYHFTSGWVDTAGKVELAFGKFEASIRLPEPLPAVWPAYWLVDDNVHCWPVGGEIDILEATGGWFDGGIYGTYHWGAACNADEWDLLNGKYATPPSPANFSQAFHNFTVYWNATTITWAVDGNPYVSRVAGKPASLFVPTWPLYTILNVAMAWWSGGQQPPSTVGFPTYMYVDWVSASAWSGPGGSVGKFPIPYNATGLSPAV